MIPIPIPAHIEGRRVVIGEPGMNPADDNAPRPAEYIVGESTLYPGAPTFSALLVLDDHEAQRIVEGQRHVWLTLDGAEVPWTVEVAHDIGDGTGQ